MGRLSASDIDHSDLLGKVLSLRKRMSPWDIVVTNFNDDVVELSCIENISKYHLEHKCRVCCTNLTLK